MKAARSRILCSLAAVAIIATAGCVSYHSLPLPVAPDLARTAAVTMPVSGLDVPGLAPHKVPAAGLDELTVMTLAVLNNPSLKAGRLQAGVARAQLLQAGLLPDPQLSAGFAASALNYGGALSLAEDIQTILQRGATQAAARASARQVNLTILWQEIQVAEQARNLFIQARTGDQLQRVLSASRTLLEENYRRDRTAMQRNDATAANVDADLLLAANAAAAWRQWQTQTNLTRHQLNALLGLQPGVHLHLIGSTHQQPLSQAGLRRALAALPHRRADLLALQAGYQSQQETLRRAVLARFPGLSVGVTFDRDPVEGVNALGPQVSLVLPFFNRHRGPIAVASATRAVLRQQYQAQLDAAAGQADQVWQASQILAGELGDVQARLPVLRQTAAAARQGLRSFNLNAGLYVTAEAAYLDQQARELRLRSSLDQARSALAVLLGLPFSAP